MTDVDPVEPVPDLASWLEEQLRADEQRALAAPEELNGNEWPFWVDVDDNDDFNNTCIWRDTFSPAVNLRTIAAHRAILEAHPLTIYTDEEPGYAQVLNDHLCPGTQTPCLTLRALAAIYQDRGGYDPRWATG